MTKIWSGVFWGIREIDPPVEPKDEGRFGSPWAMLLGTGMLAVASIAVSVWAGVLYDVAERAADDLLEPSGYVEAVLERSP